MAKEFMLMKDTYLVISEKLCKNYFFANDCKELVANLIFETPATTYICVLLV